MFLKQLSHSSACGILFVICSEGAFGGTFYNFRRLRTDRKGLFYRRATIDKDMPIFLSSFKSHGEGHHTESTFISITCCYGGELIGHLLMTGHTNA